MSNPRKNKTLKKIWLTQEELESIENAFNRIEQGYSGFKKDIGELFLKIKKRGDFLE